MDYEMEEQTPQNVQVVHTPEGVIFQIQVIGNLCYMMPLMDSQLEELYQERKRRKQEEKKNKLAVVKTLN